MEVMLKACCANCRKVNIDEIRALRSLRMGNPIDKRKPVCTITDIQRGICDKFVPSKKDLRHAIWKAAQSRG